MLVETLSRVQYFAEFNLNGLFASCFFECVHVVDISHWLLPCAIRYLNLQSLAYIENIETLKKIS